MLSGEQIAEAGLADWRKLAQGLHARYVDRGLRGPGPGSWPPIADTVDGLGDHLRVTVGDRYRRPEADQPRRDVPRRRGRRARRRVGDRADVELARRICEVAAEHGARGGPGGVSRPSSWPSTPRTRSSSAPIWAALLTGGQSRAAGARSATTCATPLAGCPTCGSRRPSEHETPRQRFHLDVFVPRGARPAADRRSPGRRGVVVRQRGGRRSPSSPTLTATRRACALS